jgi:hypothetical protein
VKRAQQRTRNDNPVLRSRDIRSEAITHKIFEELFNTNMLGSRWFTREEVETLYREHSILQPSEHIIIHAQEVSSA